LVGGGGGDSTGPEKKDSTQKKGRLTSRKKLPKPTNTKTGGKRKKSPPLRNHGPFRDGCAKRGKTPSRAIPEVIQNKGGGGVLCCRGKNSFKSSETTLPEEDLQMCWRQWNMFLRTAKLIERCSAEGEKRNRPGPRLTSAPHTPWKTNASREAGGPEGRSLTILGESGDLQSQNFGRAGVRKVDALSEEGELTMSRFGLGKQLLCPREKDFVITKDLGRRASLGGEVFWGRFIAARERYLEKKLLPQLEKGSLLRCVRATPRKGKVAPGREKLRG